MAQITRRLAEKLSKDDESLANSLGGIDADVPEAAALTRDLGHPPFGHIAEETLCKLLEANDNPDGYEGNAQSFRIVTRLAARGRGYLGLNLTRATLNALLSIRGREH